MNDDLKNIQQAPIREYNYGYWFQEVRFNGHTLSDDERKEYVSLIDETIANYSEGFQLILDSQKEFQDKEDDFSRMHRTLNDVMLFVLITMNDSMVASKYFLLADRDYDRRFMRGKLRVILNEGFKRLYGFNEKTHKKPEWDKLLPLMGSLPEEINRQYQELTNLLEKHAKSSSWWKEERDLETHIYDAMELYNSRQEEIIESKVMIDNNKLFSTLLAVYYFLTNVHACFFNYLVDLYHRGELKDD